MVRVSQGRQSGAEQPPSEPAEHVSHSLSFSHRVSPLFRAALGATGHSPVQACEVPAVGARLCAPRLCCRACGLHAGFLSRPHAHTHVSVTWGGLNQASVCHRKLTSPLESLFSAL